MAPKGSASSNSWAGMANPLGMYGIASQPKTGFGSQRSSTLSYLHEPLAFTKSRDSDPTLVVVFKNLTKKDPTTKIKALEELRRYLLDHVDSEIQETLIEAWATLYPRLAIENERSVRQISHSVQFAIFNSAPSRRSVAKHISKLVPSFLAGTGDSDKQTSDSVKSHINFLLKTDDKRKGFFIKHQISILTYVSDVLMETPETLSDERNVSKEDRDAKFTRAMSSAIYLVLELYNLPDAVNGKENSTWMASCHDEYAEILSSEKLWSCIASQDSTVRARVASLLIWITLNNEEFVTNHIQFLGNKVIVEGLRSDQSGTAAKLLDALGSLTSAHPEIWTKHLKGKKDPLHYLGKFVAKGSQGSGMYWESLSALIATLPAEILPQGLPPSMEFLKQMRTGMSDRSEMFQKSAQPTHTFLETVQRLYNRLDLPSEQTQLLEELVYPLFSQYLKSHPQQATARALDIEDPDRYQQKFWSLHKFQNDVQLPATVAAYRMCNSLGSPDAKAHFCAHIERLEQDLLLMIDAKMPFNRTEFEQSQSRILLFGQQWFRLLGEVLRQGDNIMDDTFEDVIVDSHVQLQNSSHRILEATARCLVARSGKPWSCAGLIEAAFRFSSKFVAQSPDTFASLKTFFQGNMEVSIMSPSSHFLTSALHLAINRLDLQPTEIHDWSVSAIAGFVKSLQTDDAGWRSSVSRQQLQIAEQLFSIPELNQSIRDYDPLQNNISTIIMNATQAMKSIPFIALLIKLDCVDDSALTHAVEEMISCRLSEDFDSATFDLYVDTLVSLSESSAFKLTFESGEDLARPMGGPKENTVHPFLSMAIALLIHIDISEKDGRLEKILTSAMGEDRDFATSSWLRDCILAILTADHGLMVIKVELQGAKYNARIEYHCRQPPIKLLTDFVIRTLSRSNDPDCLARWLPLYLQSWWEGLHEFARLPLNPSLAIVSQFPTARHVVNKREISTETKALTDSRTIDTRAYVRLFRICSYTLDVFEAIRSKLDPEAQSVYLAMLGLMTEAIDDCVKLGRIPGDHYDEHYQCLICPEASAFVENYHMICAEFSKDAQDWCDGPTSGLDSSSKIVYDAIGILTAPYEVTVQRKGSWLGFLQKLFANYWLDHADGASQFEYYAAKALERLMRALRMDTAPTFEDLEAFLTSRIGLFEPKTAHPELTAAILVGLNTCLYESQIVRKLLNNLVSDFQVEEISATSARQVTKKLILFHACLGVYQGEELPVAIPRLMRAMDRLFSWIPDFILMRSEDYTGTPDEIMAVELCRTLHALLPTIETISGSHWEIMIELCDGLLKSCGSEWKYENLPAAATALDLYLALNELPASNDDLRETLEMSNKTMLGNFVCYMKATFTIPKNEVLDSVEGTLLKLTTKLNYPKTARWYNSYYRQLSSDSKVIQSCCYLMIHKRLAEMRQDLSVKYQLEYDAARSEHNQLLPNEPMPPMPFEDLPPDLIDTISSSIEIFEDYQYLIDLAQDDGQEAPALLRGYLLSWLVVYQSMAASSVTLREVCIAHIAGLEPNPFFQLISLLSQTLGHDDNQQLNLSKTHVTMAQVTDFDLLDTLSLTDHDQMIALCSTLYWHALKYTPSALIAAVHGLKSRAARTALEASINKNFVQVVLRDQFDELDAWIARERSDNENVEFSVRILRGSREIVAKRELGDGFHITCTFHIPPNWPFSRIQATNQDKAVIKERTWHGIMTAVLANMMANNGSFVDGVEIFRGCIASKTKGMEECSICYSYVSSNKTMADKRCAQCRNAFHGDCLFKWFNTSNQGSCPLCRTQWSAKPEKKTSGY